MRIAGLRLLLLIAAVTAFGVAGRAYAAAAAQATPTCALLVNNDVVCPRTPGVPGPGSPPEQREWIPSGKSDPPPVAGNPIQSPGVSLCSNGDPYQIFREAEWARTPYSNTVYMDAMNRRIVGYGHFVVPADRLNLGDTITREQAIEFWNADSSAAYLAALEQAREAQICDGCFIAALASANYRLGTNWRLIYNEAWAQILAGQYKTAADLFNGTLWAEFFPAQARDFQTALRILPPKRDVDCYSPPPPPRPPIDICVIAPDLCEPIECEGPDCPGGGPPPESCLCQPPRPGALLGGQHVNLPVSFDVFHEFMGRTGWSALNNSRKVSLAAQYLNTGPSCRKFVLSYPGVPGVSSDGWARNSASFRECAAGNYNPQYQAFGLMLRAAGITHGLILRVGWEWNIATNPAMSPFDKANRVFHNELIDTYKQCFRNIVTNIRATCSDCGLMFDYNSNGTITEPLMRAGYPGDDVVDIISIEGYDNEGPKDDAAARWRVKQTSLDFTRDFAKERGKYMAVPEWAVINCHISPCTPVLDRASYGPGDNALYVQKMCEYGKNPDNNMYYSIYFGGSPGSFPWHDLSNPLNSQSRAAFVQYCGCGP